MAWMMLVISGLLEVLLIICLTKSKGFKIKKYAFLSLVVQIMSIYSSTNDAFKCCLRYMGCYR